MNCLEFRRRLGSEPASSFVDFVAHRAVCAHCAATHARAAEFDGRILSALAIGVPAGLADRILLAQTTETRREQRARRRGLTNLSLAAAASIVVAVVALNRPREDMPILAGLVLEHLHEHGVSAVDAERAVPKQDVMEAFSARGVKLASVPDGVNYVHLCPAGPYRSVHMVMSERSGQVTVVYVADKSSTRDVDFSRDGMRGRELPLGKGSLVMVASADSDFDAIERVWKTALGEGIAGTHATPGPVVGAGSPISRSWNSGAVTAAP